MSLVLGIGLSADSAGIETYISQHFCPCPSLKTHEIISAMIGDFVDFELAFVETKTISHAILIESTLLLRYKMDHGEGSSRCPRSPNMWDEVAVRRFSAAGPEGPCVAEG